MQLVRGPSGIGPESKRRIDESAPAPAPTAPWAFRQPLVVRSGLRRWRSLLGMVIGVSLGLGITLLLVGISAGAVRLVREDYEATAANLYVVQHGGAVVPVLAGDDPGTLRDSSHLLGLVRALPQVRQAIGVLTWQVERTVDGRRDPDLPTEYVVTVGIDGQAESLPNTVLMQAGRWFSRDNEVVIGSQLARKKHLAIGDPLLLEDRRLIVVGIGRLRAAGAMGSFAGQYAYMDVHTQRELAGVGDILSMVLVDATVTASVQDRLLSQVDSIDVPDRAAVLRDLDRISEHDVVITRISAALALLIAAVFVSSMLLRSVEERREELATLRAIGVAGRTIVQLVVVEAVLVTAVGTPIAIVLGNLLGAWTNQTFRATWDVEAVYRPGPQLLAVFLLLSLGLGVLASLLPSRNALRVEPADVLREA